jgi:hypothetical protein
MTGGISRAVRWGVLCCAFLTLFATAEAQAGGSGLTGGKGCQPPGNVTCGDPIHPATGGIFQQVQDYATPGPNALTLERYYNSPLNLPSYNVTFDNGYTQFGNWRSNYDSFLYLPPDGSFVDVILPDNKNFHYLPNGSGGWTGPRDINAQLSRSGGDLYIDRLERHRMDLQPPARILRELGRDFDPRPQRLYPDDNL